MSKTNYHNLIRVQSGVPLPELDEVPEKELKEHAIEMKLFNKEQWHREAITQELFNQLSGEIEALETRARELACNYPSNNNHQEIIHLLVRSTELRKLKKTYGLR